MALHLITVVGGRSTTIASMLDHYLMMGVDEVLLYIHSESAEDPVVDKIKEVAASRGVPIAGHILGDWLEVQYRIVSSIASSASSEWFIIADEDEFHYYPLGIRTTIHDCLVGGYDYVQGCFVDRFHPSGRLVEIDPSDSPWSQFSIGSFFTLPVLGGHPLKVAVARGGVKLTNSGHHRASTGIPCPISKHFIQVHHFKWTFGLLEYLTTRSRGLPRGAAVRKEDERFTRYFSERGGVIDIYDPTIMSAPCGETYPNWGQVISICKRSLLKTEGSHV